MGLRFSPLKTVFHTADDVLTADRDTLDETVLRHLKTYEGGGTIHQPVGKFNRDYYVRAMEGNVRGLGPGLPTEPEYGEKQPQVSRRIQEALHRLTVNGYLMQNPDQRSADSIVITTEGEELLSHLTQFERLEKLGLERVKNALTSNQWYPQIADSEEMRELAWRWVRKKPGQASSALSAERTVFISYRRANFPWALAVFQDLTIHGFDVFFDYDGLASGAFEQAILGNIRARAHFLVLLAPSALDRCDEPTDWLRREIEAALDARRNIVPLLIDGFDFSTPAISSRFTGKLAALKQYNALPVPAAFFPAAMDSLRGKYLNVPLDAVLHPASPSTQRAATEQRAAATEAPAVSIDELLRTVRIPEETESATPSPEIVRRRHLALSRFEAFHRNQPNWWYEKEVQQYHEIVAALEEAYGDDLSSFRVPATMMEYKIISIRRGSYSGRPGSVQRSDKLSCETTYVRQQLEGLALYLQKRLSL